MDAKELMIGDWVYDKHYNGDIEPIKIYNIYGTEVNCKTERNRFDVDEIVSGTYMSDLQPIPLTDEILEQNGFGYVEEEETCATEAFHQWRLENSRFALDDDSWWLLLKDDKLRVKFGGFLLKYVHQLQHALSLCEIDKEITI